MRSPRRSNCLVWATWRYWTRGGYLIMRRSRYGWFPHFLWSGQLKVFWSYVPRHPRRRLLPPPLFRGRVHRGK